MEFRHKKSLGQHFLKDPNITRKIVRMAEISPNEKVWEIGPGKGVLTKELLLARAHVVTFEIDKSLYPLLEEEFGAKIELVKSDILKADWHNYLLPEEKINIVANLPYQITTPFLFRTIEFFPYIKRITIMIQKEVALRLKAVPSTPDYGLLAIKLQHYYDVKYLFKVEPHLFFPPPKVDSAVVSLTPKKEITALPNEELFWKIVNCAFAARRKMLRKNLLTLFSREQMQKAESECAISFERRGESLSEKEFLAVCTAFTQC